MAKTYSRNYLAYMVPPASSTPEIRGATLTTQLWSDMVDAGFQVIATNSTSNPNVLEGATRVVFEASSQIDSLFNTNKWRIYMEAYGSYSLTMPGQTGSTQFVNTGLRFMVGSPDQVLDTFTTGQSPAATNTMPFYNIVPPAVDGNSSSGTWSGSIVNGPRIHPDRPMAYRLTTTTRGFALAIWMTDLPDNMNRMGVVAIQRGVNSQGVMTPTGQLPLFMVTNIASAGNPSTSNGDLSTGGPRSSWFYQVIREKDTIVQSPAWTTVGTRVDNAGTAMFKTLISDPNEGQGNNLARFPNVWQQPLISDTDQYLMIFPFGLCTNRFAYSEELDLIAVSKGAAFYNGQQVNLEIFGEERTYTAISSNGDSLPAASRPDAVRVFILTNGPEF